jgi:prepilin-type N-terminal cleavage/methylation domain-containing protein
MVDNLARVMTNSANSDPYFIWFLFSHSLPSSTSRKAHPTMNSLRRNFQRGLTLTELLVVMLIIGLLSTIAVPVYINRMEDARVRLALAEMREIANAQEQVAIIHGFYVPFQVLDNIPEGPNNPSDGDTIRDDFTGNLFVINPLVRPLDQQSNQLALSDANARVTAIRDRWEGPFLNPQRVYIDDGAQGKPGDPNYVNAGYYRLDFPLDPWGSPYRFYSPLGIIGSGSYTLNYNNLGVSFSDGILTTADDRNFDRYAVLSFGRDGFPDFGSLAPGTNNRDDLVYLFGAPGVESTFGFVF